MGHGMPTTTSGSDPRTFAIIGAAMEVHRVLGRAYLETFFQQALAIEFGLRNVPFQAEVPCDVVYKGHKLGGMHHLDFLCFDSVVVEVKARSAIGPAEYAQILNYLSATGHECGLLLNFGAPRLEYRRVARSSEGPG